MIIRFRHSVSSPGCCSSKVLQAGQAWPWGSVHLVKLQKDPASHKAQSSPQSPLCAQLYQRDKNHHNSYFLPSRNLKMGVGVSWGNEWQTHRNYNVLLFTVWPLDQQHHLTWELVRNGTSWAHPPSYEYNLHLNEIPGDSKAHYWFRFEKPC